ncbi:MAG: hypothetical protein ACR2ML_13995, partial [Solirubrobacteraceae bacterium]
MAGERLRLELAVEPGPPAGRDRQRVEALGERPPAQLVGLGQALDVGQEVSAGAPDHGDELAGLADQRHALLGA